MTKVFHNRNFPKQEILLALMTLAVVAMLFSLLSQSTVGGAVPWCTVIPSTLVSVTNWNPSSARGSVEGILPMANRP
eukprot:jgi/Picre1/33560/NNA_008881.t1